MPSFEPFPGLRYSLSHISSLDDVVCPPYDVISPDERLALAARNPSNIVRLEMPDVADGAGEDPYVGAAQLLDSWRDGGVLHRDHTPSFYGHRMSWTEPDGTRRRTLGVIGALRLEEPGAGSGILPHEHTLPKARSDRLALLRAARANLSPIWGLSTATGLTSLLPEAAHPVESTTDEEGVTYQLWPIDDPDTVAAVAASVASAPVLIADGHHRYATALAYQAERRAATGDNGDHDLVMALVVELVDGEIAVQAIHRLLAALPDGFDLVEALAAWAELTPTGPPDATIEARMAAAGSMAVVTADGTWLARPGPAMISGAAHDLDSSRLDVALAALPAHDVHYQHGWAHSRDAVRTGAAQAAVLVRPATVAQISAIGAGGVRMPPKTTFFWPKPRTGLVVRDLID